MGRREELLKRLNELEKMRSDSSSQSGSMGIPPGTTLQAGSLRIPLNPKLTGDEASALAAQEVFTPIGRDIKDMVANKLFSSERFGNVGRTYKQWAGSQYSPGSALLTASDPKLQRFQGKLKSMRRYVFGEGGKQLTPFESNVVMALMDPIGKSDDQYIEDVGEATKIIESKSRLALGGHRAAKRFGEI